MAVEQDAAFDRVIEPGEQLNQGGLARTVFPHQCQSLSRAEFKAKPAHRPVFTARIAEANVFEHKTLAYRHRHLAGVGQRHDLRLHVEKAEQVIQIQRLCRGGGEAGQQSLQQTAQPQERPGQEGQVANRQGALQRAGDDEGVGRVIAQRSDAGEYPAPERPLHGNPAVGGIEAFG